MKPGLLRLFLNIYPPYIGAGIRTEYISEDFREVRVRMRLRWFNRNYVNTHFGGSLYAMTDPFYMLMLMNILGNEYVVWDKAAAIEFVKPGRGAVLANFSISDEQIDTIRNATVNGDKYCPTWPVDVIDMENSVVARVLKTLYVRRKPVKV